MEPQHVIKISLNYLKRDPTYDKEKPYICLLDLRDIPGAESTNIITEMFDNIPVTNLRTCSHIKLSLDDQGFERVEFDSRFAISDFDDEKWIKAVYYKFLCDLLIEKTGATEAHVFQHTVKPH